MSEYYYKKGISKRPRKILKILSGIFMLLGIGILAYIFFPLLIWQVYLSHALAYNKVTAPIPESTVIDSSSVKNLFSDAANILSGVDYNDPHNWFSNLNYEKRTTNVPSYTISIPKINIKDAEVTTIDNNLEKHLVNYPGTAIPGENGNAVIFGHSTLPYLFDANNYKTIFANAHTLKVGDEITTKVKGAEYTYKIYDISVVDPENTSALTQNYDNSYLTIVTCTPPGTIWKRLIIKAKLEQI